MDALSYSQNKINTMAFVFGCQNSLGIKNTNFLHRRLRCVLALNTSDRDRGRLMTFKRKNLK